MIDSKYWETEHREIYYGEMLCLLELILFCSGLLLVQYKVMNLDVIRYLAAPSDEFWELRE